MGRGEPPPNLSSIKNAEAERREGRGAELSADPENDTMEIIFLDNRIAVCVKPAGAASTDEPGGVPELLRAELGQPRACALTVHRLDRVTGGLMVLARSHRAASILSRQITEGRFEKEYLAVVCGIPAEAEGSFRDLLLRDRGQRVTRVVTEARKGAQEAVLDYCLLGSAAGRGLVRVALRTGRTHQIRAQFAARGMPLAGDRKYGAPPEAEKGVALWSYRLAFDHPQSGERMDLSLEPPQTWPWTEFEELLWKRN